MNPIGLLTLPSSTPLVFKLGRLRPEKHCINIYDHRNRFNQRKVRNKHGTCRAELSADAPIAVAIGACILSSLVFPIAPSPEDEEADSVIDTADARFAVMGIISFIPYFNWLSWVFAWMDTGNRRYAVYAIVYLAPYIRSNLSLSPEESWLPIASILLCILHIQLEVSIKNGDLQGFQLFNEVGKHGSSNLRKKEERNKDHRNLPSMRNRSENDISSWGGPEKPFRDPEGLHNDEEADGGSKH